MDISGMTEEEQLEAAMRLSMGQEPGPPAAAPAAPTQAAAPAPPVRARPRAFPGKDAQDSLPPPTRSSAKRKRGGDVSARPDPDQVGERLQLGAAEAAELLRLLFGQAPECQDVERWLTQGFQFSPTSSVGWGLWQKHGGPCGVFAPVQAFLIRHLLFGGGAAEAPASAEAGAARAAAPDKELVKELFEKFVAEGNDPNTAAALAMKEAASRGAAPDAQRSEQPLAVAGDHQEEERLPLLAHALTSVLYCAAGRSSYVVCQVAPAVPDGVPAPERSAAAAAAVLGAIATGAGVAVTGRRVARAAEAQQLLEDGADSWLAGPFGVLSFACSVLLTRTCSAVREDMDDPDTPLIGRFGHCSQELVNLMLIGEATSNVFDGSRWLGDDPSSGLLVKGVDSDRVGLPPVGFLSELEPMRYLSVGTSFKYPEYPIWVLGSPTHYTVIFSARRRDSQLSEAAQLEQRAKKVFVDNSLDDGGLAMASNLPAMLEALGVGGDQLDKARTDLVREDVVVWPDFRDWTSRHFGVSGGGPATAEAGRLQLFLYDGQDPPGPSLRRLDLELSDIDPSLAGGSDADTLSATLHTRWPNAVVEVRGLAGAAARGATG